MNQRPSLIYSIKRQQRRSRSGVRRRVQLILLLLLLIQPTAREFDPVAEVGSIFHDSTPSRADPFRELCRRSSAPRMKAIAKSPKIPQALRPIVTQVAVIAASYMGQETGSWFVCGSTPDHSR